MSEDYQCTPKHVSNARRADLGIAGSKSCRRILRKKEIRVSLIFPRPAPHIRTSTNRTAGHKGVSNKASEGLGSIGPSPDFDKVDHVG